MPSKAHLIQRNGRWYFNRRFPKELWPITGSNPFRLALQTDSLQLAIRSRPDAERRFWVVADEARKKLGETQPRPLSEVEAVAIVSRWFVERNAELDSDHLHDPEPAEIMQEVIDGTVYVIGDDSRRLAASDLEGYSQLAETVLSEAGVKADPESKGYRALLQLLVRANKELALIDLARLRGDFGYRPSDPVFVQALAAPERPARTISQLIEAYTEDRGTKRNWSPSTKAAYEPVWRLLKDTLGSSRDVATITRDDGRLLFETVKSLPRNLGKIKALEGLPVPKAVERARQLQLPTIGPKTINSSYMGFLASVFEWAVKEQWITANPASGLSVGDPVDEKDKRAPFTTEQLKHIFGAAPWSPRDDAPRGKPLHFWGPLIALYHGMRRGEIAQLDVADIAIVDGVHVIHIRPDVADGKRVKSKAGRRMLPIHSELIRMGFLAFAGSQRKAGQKQLFPGEAPNSNGQWGDGLTDWFLRLLKAQRITGLRLGMHSFRHNFEDRLRSAGLRGTDVGKELAGRSKGNDVGDKYGSGYSAAELAEALAKVTYPGLDLSHLYVAGID